MLISNSAKHIPCLLHAGDVLVVSTQFAHCRFGGVSIAPLLQPEFPHASAGKGSVLTQWGDSDSFPGYP